MVLLIGFLIDCILGDPYRLPHPIRLIGSLIRRLDKMLYRKEDKNNKKFVKGMLLVVLVNVLSV